MKFYKPDLLNGARLQATINKPLQNGEYEKFLAYHGVRYHKRKLKKKTRKSDN